MQLAEEYLKRHGINIPFVRHVKQGYLFVRRPSDVRMEFRILSIKRQVNWRHPSQYKINIMMPRHNNYGDGRMFDLTDDVIVPWDEFSEWISDPFGDADNKTSLILGKKEAWVCAWEMFVYCCDSGFADRVNDRIFWASLDDEMSIDERYSAIQEILERYKNSMSRERMWSMWHDNIETFLKNYCFWLEDILNKKENDNNE